MGAHEEGRGVPAADGAVSAMTLSRPRARVRAHTLVEGPPRDSWTRTCLSAASDNPTKMLNAACRWGWTQHWACAGALEKGILTQLSAQSKINVTSLHVLEPLLSSLFA